MWWARDDAAQWTGGELVARKQRYAKRRDKASPHKAEKCDQPPAKIIAILHQSLCTAGLPCACQCSCSAPAACECPALVVVWVGVSTLAGPCVSGYWGGRQHHHHDHHQAPGQKSSLCILTQVLPRLLWLSVYIQAPHMWPKPYAHRVQLLPTPPPLVSRTEGRVIQHKQACQPPSQVGDGALTAL